MNRFALNKNYIFYNFKRYKILFLVYTVLLLYIFPIGPLVNALFLTGEKYTYEYSLNFWLSFLIIVSISLLLVTPYIFFQYSKSKRAVDVFHALPISRTALFVNNAVSSLLMVLIPFSLAFWLGMLITPVMATFSLFSASTPITYLAYIIFAIAIETMIFFVIVHTGTSSDAIIYGLVITLIPLVFALALEIFLSSILLGYPATFSLVKYISPLSAFFSVSGERIDYQLILAGYWSILSLILFSLSLYHYRKLKSETIESPFTSRYFYPLLAYLSTLIVFLFVFSISDNSYSMHFNQINLVSFVAPLVIGAVFYVILDAIRNRSFKYFIHSLKYYLGIAAISIILILSSIFTGGFGYNTAVPSLGNTQSVRLDFSPSELLFNVNTKENYYFTTATVLIEEADQIGQVQDFHREIISHLLGRADDYTIYQGHLELNYDRRFGTQLHRIYQIDTTANLNTFQSLFTDPDLFIQLFPILDLKRDVRVNQLIYNERAFRPSKSFDRQAFYDAFKKDLLENPMTSTLQFGNEILFSLNYSLVKYYSDSPYDEENSIIIPENYTHTIDYLRSVFPSVK